MLLSDSGILLELHVPHRRHLGSIYLSILEVTKTVNMLRNELPLTLGKFLCCSQSWGHQNLGYIEHHLPIRYPMLLISLYREVWVRLTLPQKSLGCLCGKSPPIACTFFVCKVFGTSFEWLDQTTPSGIVYLRHLVWIRSWNVHILPNNQTLSCLGDRVIMSNTIVETVLFKLIMLWFCDVIFREKLHRPSVVCWKWLWLFIPRSCMIIHSK